MALGMLWDGTGMLWDGTGMLWDLPPFLQAPAQPQRMALGARSAQPHRGRVAAAGHTMCFPAGSGACATGGALLLL